MNSAVVTTPVKVIIKTGPRGRQGTQGNTGPAIELQTTGTHIQWRVVGAATWTNLIALSALVGPPGTTTFAGLTDLPTANAALAPYLTQAERIEMVVAASDETSNLTTGTGRVTFRVPRGFTLTGVRTSVNTAPVGNTIIVDVNKNGVSVFTTRVSIDAGEKTSVTAATPAVLDAAQVSIADDDEITIDIDQVGSSTAGRGLKVTLLGTRA